MRPRNRWSPWLAACLIVLANCAPAATGAVADAAVPDTAAGSGGGVSLAADAGLASELDAVLRDAFPADEPGAAVIVVRDGEVLLRAGYGMADLELGVPISPEHVFRIGSITKQFTGAAILMLAEEGELSLYDPVTRFHPDYPTGGRTVTVEQLLGHTSGIRSYTGMREWAPTRRQDLTLEELKALFRDQPFDFEPGDRYRYNNSGYILLGAIIEELSGMTYGDFVASRIFEPLGMSASRYGDVAPVIPNRVAGYSRGGDGWVNADYLSMTHPHAAGALLSSVDDLARWDAAMTAGEIMGAEAWERALTPVTLNDGRSTGYAAGWMLGRLGPYETVEHGGGINGFSAYALRVPEARLFVAVLANADQPLASPSQLAVLLADMVLGGVMDQPAIAVTEDRLRDYVGVYRVDDTVTRTITLQDGRLLSQRTGGRQLELRPIGDDLFLFPDTGTLVRFERYDGEVRAMLVDPRLGLGERAPRETDAPALRPSDAGP